MADRRLEWIGTSREDLKRFPEEVRRAMGVALRWAQRDDKHPNSKPLTGFGGAGVLEIVEDDDRNTYRAAYTITLPGAIYVLHEFQKKSTRGIQTSRRDIELIRERLQAAQARSSQVTGGEGRQGRRP